MSKRRLDGSVVVASRRRKRDLTPLHGCKRGRFAEPFFVDHGCLGKRKAFESEIDSMHKRLRTMPPRCTPEQVVAVLLPHLLRLKSVYVQEQQRTAQLEKNNAVLANAVKHLNENNMALTSRLEAAGRELEMCRYRLVMSQSYPHQMSGV
jgi:hypothetical protein|tara:strand:+ start:789 stop:1238 length:450 start_codon:yes stop_codon:yes gene_type:complete